MPECALEQVSRSIELLYRADSGRILATLIRLLGDFDLAEDSMHEAFAAALDAWHKTGIPINPRPWLISTARFKAIDTMRRRARFDASQQDLVRHLEAQPVQELPEPEVMGLLALMLLQESRRGARISPAGDLILLEQQDRTLWDRVQIAEGIALVEKSLRSHRFGSYTLQAAIAAVHAEADSAATTDWRQIVMLYNRLAGIQPSPVVELNRAVAIAMCEGPDAGLRLIECLLESGKMANYHLAHSARADLCRRLGRTAEARSSYERALTLTQQQPERRFLLKRLRDLK